MATGFMRFTYFMAVALALACGAARAGDVALVGTIGDKAAILAVDGGNPKAVRVGQSWSGVTVLGVEEDRATIESEGKKRILLRGQTYQPTGTVSARPSVTLASDASGHFLGDGAVNGIPVRFIVDTGASTIALPGADAQRLGIDYRKGRRGMSQTANGAVPIYLVTLDRVRLGAIELTGVEAVVIERGLNVALLGMSFLNRVEMHREGRTMMLIRRF